MPSLAHAVVIITGGGGFLGQCLASALLEEGKLSSDSLSDACDSRVPISKIILADVHFSALHPTIQQAGSVVRKIQGDVSDPSFCHALLAEAETERGAHVSIFHLSAVMSGDGERDFDLCMRVNLHGTINMLEAARHAVYSKRNFPAKFILVSAGATIGSGTEADYISKDDVVSDASRAVPHTTYGMTKACSELLMSDYARRGFVDARGIRLPTIAGRPGASNGATTSCFSAVIREPLSGNDVTLRINKHVSHALSGMRAATTAMILLHNIALKTIHQVLGYDRTVFLPSIALSLEDFEDALYRVVSPESRSKLGKITYQVDDCTSAIVESFPTKINAYRAIKLGLPAAPDAETLIREYMADFPSAVAEGIHCQGQQPAGSTPSRLTLNVGQKVAVVTGAGSGIGRAVAERLSRGGWALVLAGRKVKTLHQTQHLLMDGNACLCLPTDVSVEADVERLFDMTEKTFGRVDLLFNNAGINSTAANVENVSFADFDQVMRTNVYGPFLCARAAMRLMAKCGGGRIINNGSLSAHVPRPGSACYSTSKHAVLGLTKCIALDGRAINVACGQIDFGNVVSEMSLRTNKVGIGAPQPNGSSMVEPSMSLIDAAESVWFMANLPLEANILQMTVMATAMPFVGRG